MLYLLLLSVCVRLCFEREWNRVMGARGNVKNSRRLEALARSREPAFPRTGITYHRHHHRFWILSEQYSIS